ncbi:MAG: methyltransferase family protein [Planctomycetota bacterium]
MPRAARMAVYATVFLGVVLVLLPWLFHASAHRWLPWRLSWAAARIPGWSLFVLALIGYVTAATHLVRVGHGAYVEFDPPARLVETGPYALCRNPLVVCVLAMLLGLALAFSSVGILLLFGLALPLAGVQVVAVEEPLLRRRFGTAYVRYAERVPRWWPRWRAGSAP